MNDYFKDIYKDFFGVETQKEETNKIEESSQNTMTTLFERINKLYIKDESKELLKKIIEYMRKYNEGIETNYIPFNILIEINNKETKEELIYILETASINFNYIKNNNKKTISLINLDKDINYDTGFITITNLKGINNIDTKDQTNLFNNLEEFLEKEEKTTTLVIGTKEEILNFFLGRENIKNKYFTFNIIGTTPDIQDIYQYILENTNIEDNIKTELLDYITKTYKNDNYVEYRNNLIKYISFNKELPKIEEKKTLEEIFKDLNELVGLEKVKKVLYDLVDVINLKEKAKDLTIKDMNLHMVFLGNPGTGKTTIARIISNILYNLGYIKENKLIEVSSKDLVGQYVGQTSPKTMDVINKSLNGVLFIDEAYTLAVKGENSYNAEAIATLIQAMENYRDKLVVIFAGYTKEMQDFLDSNSGIVSRIGYTLEFEDYKTEELIKIFNNFATKNGFTVNEEAIKYLEEIINKNRNTKNFGNARFIRNIYEKTIIKHATNVKNKKQNKILKTITKNDISIENLNLK
jgi:Holliday junction resolvasome RuvABC ATP-dependent DNA helicase subunit